MKKKASTSEKLIPFGVSFCSIVAMWACASEAGRRSWLIGNTHGSHLSGVPCVQNNSIKIVLLSERMHQSWPQSPKRRAHEGRARVAPMAKQWPREGRI